MRRIDGYRREQRVQFPFAVVADEIAGRLVQLIESQDADAVLRERRTELLVPAVRLRGDELVRLPRQFAALVLRRQAVGAGLGVAVFDPLQQAGHADLEELIQIAGGDGQELDPLQHGIALVLGLFQHAAVEGQPRGLAIQEVSRLVNGKACHRGDPAMIAERC